MTDEFRITIEDKIDWDKFERNYPKAQYQLDKAIVNSFLPYVPIRMGTLRANIVARNAVLAGTGQVAVYTGTPYGRYLYYGVKMVDSQTGKGARKIELPTGEVIFRHRKGAKLVPTATPLKFRDPMAQAKWFEVAKQNYEEQWKQLVKEALLNG